MNTHQIIATALIVITALNINIQSSLGSYSSVNKANRHSYGHYDKYDYGSHSSDGYYGYRSSLNRVLLGGEGKKRGNSQPKSATYTDPNTATTSDDNADGRGASSSPRAAASGTSDASGTSTTGTPQEDQEPQPARNDQDEAQFMQPASSTANTDGTSGTSDHDARPASSATSTSGSYTSSGALQTIVIKKSSHPNLNKITENGGKITIPLDVQGDLEIKPELSMNGTVGGADQMLTKSLKVSLQQLENGPLTLTITDQTFLTSPRITTPCFGSPQMYKFSDTTFFAPAASSVTEVSKKYQVQNLTQCYTYKDKVTVLTIKYNINGKSEKFELEEPRNYWHTSTEMKPASQYFCPNKDKACDEDQDPLVFYNDDYVGFWRGWPNNWFQGYMVTPETSYKKGSRGPVPNLQHNEFTFLRYKGHKWASSEHFLFWARDQLMNDGEHENSFLLAHPNHGELLNDIDIPSLMAASAGNDEETKKIQELHVHLSPSPLFKLSRKWNNAVGDRIKKAKGEQAAKTHAAPWFACNFFIQVKALWLKFTQNASLRKKLLATGDRKMFEISPTDNAYALDPSRSIEEPGLLSVLQQNDENYFKTGKGFKSPKTNILGRALMVTRELIKIAQNGQYDKIALADLTDGQTLAKTIVHNAKFDQCEPILLDKDLDWLELDNFEMPTMKEIIY